MPRMLLQTAFIHAQSMVCDDSTILKDVSNLEVPIVVVVFVKYVFVP